MVVAQAPRFALGVAAIAPGPVLRSTRVAGAALVGAPRAKATASVTVRALVAELRRLVGGANATVRRPQTTPELVAPSAPLVSGVQTFPYLYERLAYEGK